MNKEGHKNKLYINFGFKNSFIKPIKLSSSEAAAQQLF